jgi:hypothetical protein
MLFLICSFVIFSSHFIKDTSGMNPFNGKNDPDLPSDFVRKWEDSQVFIYYKTKFAQKFTSEYPYPDCFGNLVTAEYVITAMSCFMDLKKFKKSLREGDQNIKLGWLKAKVQNNLILTFLMDDIGKIIIAKVLLYAP